MATFLTYLLGLLVVGGALFLLASFAFGRGEELAPMPPDGTPVELPGGRPAGGDDLRRLRLSVVLRGYRMEEVDWVLAELADQLDERDREIARLRGESEPAPPVPPLAAGPAGEPTDAELTDPDLTDPGLADVELTDPELADAGLTDPGLADAELTDPGLTDPGLTDPGLTDPGLADAGLTDPELADAELADRGRVD